MEKIPLKTTVIAERQILSDVVDRIIVTIKIDFDEKLEKTAQLITDSLFMDSNGNVVNRYNI